MTNSQIFEIGREEVAFARPEYKGLPEFRQLVHGISLSHFTFRLVHPSQLNLAVEAIWVRDTFRIPFAFMSAGSPGVESMRLESGKFQLGW